MIRSTDLLETVEAVLRERGKLGDPESEESQAAIRTLAASVMETVRRVGIQTFSNLMAKADELTQLIPDEDQRDVLQRVVASGF